jgi:hypothetical protein
MGIRIDGKYIGCDVVTMTVYISFGACVDPRQQSVIVMVMGRLLGFSVVRYFRDRGFLAACPEYMQSQAPG